MTTLKLGSIETVDECKGFEPVVGVFNTLLHCADGFIPRVNLVPRL